LPVCDCHLIHAKLVRHVSLPQPEVKPSLPEVVTQSPELPGIGQGPGFLTHQLQMAKRQRGDVPAATSEIRSITACAARSAWSAISRACPARCSTASTSTWKCPP